MLKSVWVGTFLLLGLAALSIPVFAYPDFSISISPSSASLCPTSTIGSYTDGSSLEVVLRNDGDIADTYELSLALPEDWSGFIMPLVTLGPGEKKMVDSVWITPQATVKPGTYTVSIKAKSKTYGVEKTASLKLEILKCHQADLELQASAATCRGIPLELELSATNYGKYEEEFSLSSPTSWAVFADDTVSIPSGETRTLTLTLEPPMELTGTQSIEVLLESQDSYAQDSETLTLKIEECYSFEASLEPASQTVCKGKASDYILRVSNKGTRTDSYTVYTPGWITPDAQKISLSPGESREVILSANAISTGVFNFNATVVSGRYPLYPELRQVLFGTADARECRGVAVVLSPSSSEICSNQGAEYQATVKNIGTVADTFILESTLGKLDQDKVVLEPGKSTTVTLGIAPGEAPGEKTVMVKASADGVYDQDEAVLLVEKCYSAGIVITPAVSSVCPCSAASFEAELTNDGKLADTFTFTLQALEQSIEETLELLPGESKALALELPIACNREAGNVKITAEAVSGNTQAREEASLNVKEMTECYSLDMTPATGSQKTVIGRAAVFAVTLKNTGEVADSYELILVGPEWSYLGTEALDLEPGQSKIVYLYASPTYGSALQDYNLGLAAASDFSTANIVMKLGIVSDISQIDTGQPFEPGEPEEPLEPGPITPPGNVSANVSMNVSIGGTGPATGQVIAEGVALSWKIIAVTLIALGIVVILITRFVILIR